MTPVQRSFSGRFPTGFDFTYGRTAPRWILNSLPKPLVPFAKVYGTPAFAPAYTLARRQVLRRRIQAVIAEPASEAKQQQAATDEVVSCMQRAMRFTEANIKVRVWLGAYAHYGHTVSGEWNAPAFEDSGVLQSIAAATNAAFSFVPPTKSHGSRRDPNSRWLVSYTFGVQDTDALCHIVSGEVYIPMTLAGAPKAAQSSPLQFERRWTYPAVASTLLRALIQAPAPLFTGADGTAFKFTVSQDAVEITATVPNASSIKARLEVTEGGSDATMILRGVSDARTNGSFAMFAQLGDSIGQGLRASGLVAQNEAPATPLTGGAPSKL